MDRGLAGVGAGRDALHGQPFPADRAELLQSRVHDRALQHRTAPKPSEQARPSSARQPSVCCSNKGGDEASALNLTTGLTWVNSGYTISFGGLLLPGARAGAILGRRRVFMAGILLFTFASLLGGLAQEPWQLPAVRALQGVGGAIASPTSLALIRTTFPVARC